MQTVLTLLMVALGLVSGSSWAGYPYWGPHYGGPLASPVVLPSGYLADTPEVAEAKHTHANRLAIAAAAAAAAPDNSWSTAPVVLPSGYLADTPEVAAAKAAHFAEIAKAGGAYYWGAPYVPHHKGW